MCGRFALGVSGDVVRMGVADYLPNVIGGQRHPAGGQQRQRRAQAGQERRDRDRIRRERRRGGPVNATPDDEIDAPAAEPEESNAATDNEEEQMSQAEQARRLRERAQSIPWDDEDRWRAENYNVAPRSNCPVVLLRPTAARLRGGGEGGENVVSDISKEEEFDIGNQKLNIETMQWGLIPHWSKHPPSAPLNTINARSENLIDNAGGMWQSLKGPKRCVLMVQGYYEWQKKGGTKIPHFTKLPQKGSTPRLMALAGLHDSVKYVDSPADEPPHKTFTILTTTPSKSLAFLHDRMPCILDSEEEILSWLDCREGWTSKVANLLRPYEGDVECYPVPKEVGKVGTNSSTYIEPVSERKDGIASFFKKQEEKTQSGPSTTKAKPMATPVKSEPVHSPVRVKKEESKVIAGLGDDSNAPQETIKEESGKGKRKAATSEKADETQPQQRSSKRLRTLHLAKPPPTKQDDSDGDIEILDEEQYIGQAKAKSHRAKSEAKAEDEPAQTSLDDFIVS